MIGKSIDKLDSMSLLDSKPAYTEDFATMANVLTIKILRSPHAFAKIKSINVDIAKKVPGVVDIFTYKDVPDQRYSEVGESFPEASPHDRLLLEPLLRYVGDEVAIIAAEDEKSALKAMKIIKVEYEVLQAILDPRLAADNDIVIHPEDDDYEPFPFGYENKRNVVSEFDFSKGDIDKAFEESDVIIEHEYSTQAQAHGMLETHKSYAYIDSHDRVVIISTNQSAYHARRQVAKANKISLNKVRVIKPRIGGGFGGKNVAVLDPYTAFVSIKTGRASKLFFTREETFSYTASRHPMQFKVKVGAKKDGTVNAIHTKALNNTGAYGGNGPATTMEAGQNIYPAYNIVPAIKFEGKTVYTNLLPSGALRGYGATQGVFAMESALNELAKELNIDPNEIRLKNTVRKGEVGGFFTEPLRSFNIEGCINRGKELISWNEKYPSNKSNANKARGVGMAIGMHGSGIAYVDFASVTFRLNEDGTYNLLTGSADLGTGSDTILAQIAASTLNTDIKNIAVISGDTDSGPYDAGAYGSSTTNITGNATIRAAKKMKDKLLLIAEKSINIPSEQLVLESDRISAKEDKSCFITLNQIGINSAVSPDGQDIIVSGSYGVGQTTRPISAGFAEVEVDKSTGEFKLIEYVLCVDCGTVINPKLAKIQAEGGLVQGIGLAMFEDPKYNAKGELLTNNFMQYKMPSKKDLGKITIDFVPEYEPSGPYGAKSLGELVVHTASPAIADAVFNACGVRVRDLPVTAEKVFLGLNK